MSTGLSYFKSSNENIITEFPEIFFPQAYSSFDDLSVANITENLARKRASKNEHFLSYLFLISDDMVKKAVSTLMDSFALVSRKFIPNDSAKA
jgi:hypothetical protein